MASAPSTDTTAVFMPPCPAGIDPKEWVRLQKLSQKDAKSKASQQAKRDEAKEQYDDLCKEHGLDKLLKKKEAIEAKIALLLEKVPELKKKPGTRSAKGEGKGAGKGSEWWERKITDTSKYPLGTDKIFKCKFCPKTYFSKDSLDKHHKDAKTKTKSGTCVPVRGDWKEAYAEDTLENRKKYWKRS